MTYVDYEFYCDWCGNEMDEQQFSRLNKQAERYINKATVGVDGVKKLKVAFPTKEDDAEAVKICVCEVVSFLYKLKKTEENSSKTNTYIEKADGTLQGRVISSISSGNESISFANVKNETVVTRAISNAKTKENEIFEIIKNGLSGIRDRNGINLLYMGPYLYEA